MRGRPCPERGERLIVLPHPPYIGGSRGERKRIQPEEFFFPKARSPPKTPPALRFRPSGEGARVAQPSPRAQETSPLRGEWGGRKRRSTPTHLVSEILGGAHQVVLPHGCQLGGWWRRGVGGSRPGGPRSRLGGRSAARGGPWTLARPCTSRQAPSPFAAAACKLALLPPLLLLQELAQEVAAGLLHSPPPPPDCHVGQFLKAPRECASREPWACARSSPPPPRE